MKKQIHFFIILSICSKLLKNKLVLYVYANLTGVDNITKKVDAYNPYYFRHTNVSTYNICCLGIVLSFDWQATKG